MLVPLGELGGNFREKTADLVFGKRHDPFDDPGHPLRIARSEGPQEHARQVGLDDRAGAVNVNAD